MSTHHVILQQSLLYSAIFIVDYYSVSSIDYVFYHLNSLAFHRGTAGSPDIASTPPSKGFITLIPEKGFNQGL